MPRQKNPRRKVLELTRDIKRTVEALRRAWTVESTVYESRPGNGVSEPMTIGFMRPREAHEYPEASLIYWNSLYREAAYLETLAIQLKVHAAEEFVKLDRMRTEEAK